MLIGWYLEGRLVLTGWCKAELVLGIRTRGAEEERRHPPTFPASAQRPGVVGANNARRREGAVLGATVAALLDQRKPLL